MFKINSEFFVGMVFGIGLTILAIGLMDSLDHKSNWGYARKCLVEYGRIYDPNLGTETCWTKDGRRIFIEGF